MELDDLLEAGTREYQDRMIDSEIEFSEPDYSREVPVAVDVDTGDIISIKLDSTKRLGAFGPSGSGKTTLAKALMSRAGKGGWKQMHFSDVKNDFRTYDRKGGASKKLQKVTEGLLPGEETGAQERVMAIPHFMAQHYDSRPQYGTIFSMALSDLTISEFKFLSGFHEWDSESAREALEEILSSVELQEISLDYLEDRALEYQNTLERKIEGLKGKKLLTDRVNYNLRDVLGMFNEKEVFSLGLDNWRKYLNGQEHFFQFYSAKTLRTVKKMIDSGEIDGDKFIFFFDEFHKLAPQGKESMVKPEFQDLYDVSGRQLGVATFIASQRPTQLPNPENLDDLDFISDLTDVFLMRGRTPLNEDQWKMIVKGMGVYNSDGGQQLRKWQRKIQSLDRFEGVYINSEKHHGPDDCPRIRTLSPLVAHPG